ncbi:MAG: hypothetical protein OJF49_001027 [Ktedonobacterales bacterium]|nr:MAG: hypothetical protein OJF49_001027 [Ktedonobacterales bacterium]
MMSRGVIWRPRCAGQGRRTGILALCSVALCAVVLLAGCSNPLRGANPVATGTKAGGSALIQTVTGFDPSVGAPLPTYRIVAAYGIVGGVQFNGPASNLDLLNSFLPQLQDLGKQYAALDPTHPVKLAIDLVVNTIQPCAYFAKWCASFTDDATMQAYIKFCQDHDLLLFYDMQLGTEPVSDAINNYLMPYLSKYPFTELALDTEFHFPNTPEGYAEAAAYPAFLGWMDASEVNWAINALAQISLKNQLPRKVLVIHQWNTAVLHNKDKIQRNPNVSVVLQSDGFGSVENKLGDYQYFVQQDLLQYGGYKLFYTYQGGAASDTPLQSPQDVMSIFPQPIFISYE